jgi:hypothetical protein
MGAPPTATPGRGVRPSPTAAPRRGAGASPIDAPGRGGIARRCVREEDGASTPCYAGEGVAPPPDAMSGREMKTASPPWLADVSLVPPPPSIALP